jgi:hypothetical protein
VVSQKEFAYKELNIFRQTMPSSGVTWNSLSVIREGSLPWSSTGEYRLYNEFL